MKQSKNRERSAFTLTELLAINAVAVALAATVLPAFTQANGGVRQAYCASNKHQLGLAWLMYAADNRGLLVLDNGGGVFYNAPSSQTSWANGWEDFQANNTDNTNVMNLIGTGSRLTGTQFGPYLKDIRVEKCPCDVYLCTERTARLPRLRSVSMNAWVGLGVDQGLPGTFINYVKLSDIVRPPPAMLWVFSDEHPDSINDSWLIDSPRASLGPYEWSDLPGSYHTGGNVMAFADGHAEYHQWRDGSGTVQPVLQIQRNGFTDPEGLDPFWFGLRTTALPQ